MALLLGIVVSVNIWRVGEALSLSKRIVHLRVPTASASSTMLTGTHHALSALRGWILLGKPEFKQDRAKAWSQEIENSMAYLKKASTKWTNPENIKRLQAIEGLLVKFKQAQQEIEEIAQTRANIPSYQILLEQAAPQATIMSAKITELIDFEAREKATRKRKALLGMMADVRGTLGLALANIRAYLLSGDPTFKRNYEKLWAKNERRFQDLSNNFSLLTPKQRVAFRTLAKARRKFSPLPPKMLRMRGKKDWNLANYWLSTKAAPIGLELIKIMQIMMEDQEQLLRQDGEAIANMIDQLMVLEWILLFLGILLAAACGFLITRNISIPLQNAVYVSSKLSEGDLSIQVSVDGKDELQQLLSSMKRMIQQLKGIVGEIKMQVNFQSQASNELSDYANIMASNSQSVKDQTSGIASFSEQVTGNVENVAALAEQASGNIISISSSVEELSANIDTIAAASEQAAVNLSGIDNNTGKISKEIETVASSVEMLSTSMENAAKETNLTLKDSQEASQEVVKTLETMTKLSETASKVGQISKMINAITSQTNMLALNATIEAASAGASGKGFAVVASEIKALALQTTEANNEIANRVGEIQTQSHQSLDYVRNVTHLIKEVSKRNQSLYGVIEQQSTATKELSNRVDSISEASKGTANNLSEAILGIREVSRSVAEASLASRETARNISQGAERVQEIAASSADVVLGITEVNKNIRGVQSSIEEVDQGVSNTKNSAAELTLKAKKLKETIAFFKLEDLNSDVETTELS